MINVEENPDNTRHLIRKLNRYKIFYAKYLNKHALSVSDKMYFYGWSVT